MNEEEEEEGKNNGGISFNISKASDFFPMNIT